MTLKTSVSKHEVRLQKASETGKQKELDTHAVQTRELEILLSFRKDTYADVLYKARCTLAGQLRKLKAWRITKVKAPDSIETQIFKVMKEVGVELSSYHGGSLNGKDIIKVMNNAMYLFDKFALILREGKRPTCRLSDDDIDAMCRHFREVFVLWDGAFSLARTVNPSEQDTKTY